VTVKILIVDDEPRYCDLMQRAIASPNFSVITSNSGEEARGILEREKIDLLVTDLDMPVVNGFELLESHSVIQGQTPVLVVTAQKSMLEDCRRRLDGHHYLLKPFSINDLRAKVNLLAGQRPTAPDTQS